MSAVKSIFSAPKPDPQIQADRLAAKREAEEQTAELDAKAADRRNARLGGTVGYGSLFGAGRSNTKSLLG